MYIIDSISLISSKDEKCFRKSCRENQNINFVFKNFSDNRAICEIMLKNIVNPPQAAVDNMAHAHCVLDN